SEDIVDTIIIDIQRVKFLVESCLSRRPCTGRTTQFHIAQGGDPDYNITIIYSSSTLQAPSNTLYSFQLSTNTLDLNATTCVYHKDIFRTHHTYGSVRLSDVVLLADVIVTDSGRCRISNSALCFGDTVSYSVGSDRAYLGSVRQRFKTFIDEQC
uniref:Spike protein n=1 Tax=Mesocestoides corti TaxID=53468 RepID=A0A5K3G424_MESCO